MALGNNNTYNTSNKTFNKGKNLYINSTHLEQIPLLNSINKIAKSNKPQLCHYLLPYAYTATILNWKSRKKIHISQ